MWNLFLKFVQSFLYPENHITCIQMADEQLEGNDLNTNNSELDSEDDLFYFESDHLALKGNKDYSELLKTIFILEAQRNRAIKDYDQVIELRRKALEDPFLFVQKLKDQESLDVPDVQVITEVPNVDWSKYNVEIPEEGLKFINATNKTDNVNKLSDKHLKRANTHNKSWTSEEQKRLEELLIVYPPEVVELRRFKKIAAALGNRTVKQVSSRVQKYFLKLYKAGLPIPGRIPKNAEKSKKSKLHTHQRYNHYLCKPTTFFPQLDIPVSMNESEEVPGPSFSLQSPPKTSNYLIPDPSYTYDEVAIEESEEYYNKQIEILRKVKCEMLKYESGQFKYTHVDYLCACCKNTIEGARWHCKTCEPVPVDYCNSCIVFQIHANNSHPILHKLEVVLGSDTYASRKSSESSSNSKSKSSCSSNKNNDSSNETSSLESDVESDESLNQTDIDDVSPVTRAENAGNDFNPSYFSQVQMDDYNLPHGDDNFDQNNSYFDSYINNSHSNHMITNNLDFTVLPENFLS